LEFGFWGLEADCGVVVCRKHPELRGLTYAQTAGDREEDLEGEGVGDREEDLEGEGVGQTDVRGETLGDAVWGGSPGLTDMAKL
jgi:hypothetical protein